MATAPNVTHDSPETISLPRSLFGKPGTRSYRAAVKQIILDLKARYRLSNDGLGDRIGVEGDTVRNAENEIGSLNAVTLMVIAYEFGEDAIAPVRQLYLCAPTEQATVGDRLERIEREAAAIRREVAR